MSESLLCARQNCRHPQSSHDMDSQYHSCWHDGATCPCNHFLAPFVEDNISSSAPSSGIDAPIPRGVREGGTKRPPPTIDYAAVVRNVLYGVMNGEHVEKNAAVHANLALKELESALASSSESIASLLDERERLTHARNAWEEFATHMLTCADCAENVDECPTGSELHEVARTYSGPAVP